MKIVVLVLGLIFMTSCSRKWTDKDKSEFLSGCLSASVKDTLIGEVYARDYCSCLLQKVVEHYPNANDVQYIRYDTAVKQLARECLEMVQRP